MVLAIGFVLVGIYTVLTVFAGPPWWMSSIGAGVTALLFSGLAGHRCTLRSKAVALMMRSRRTNEGLSLRLRAQPCITCFGFWASLARMVSAVLDLILLGEDVTTARGLGPDTAALGQLAAMGPIPKRRKRDPVLLGGFGQADQAGRYVSGVVHEALCLRAMRRRPVPGVLLVFMMFHALSQHLLDLVALDPKDHRRVQGAA